jgi:DNA polymerase III delta subunit
MPGPCTPEKVREQIAAGALEPLYLVTGEDEAEMTALASELADSVEEELRAFNVQRFYGSDAGTTLDSVLAAAGTFPLLAPRRVVLLMQAQVLFTGKKAKAAEAADAADAEGAGDAEGQSKGSELSRLKEYAGRPHAHAVVVLVGRGLERTFAALARQAVVVTCAAPADVLGDLEREFGVRFDERARRLLRAHAGEDVGTLRGDVERVLLYAAGRTEIGQDQVSAAISTSAAAAGGGKLWSDVSNRRTAAALRELRLELAEGGVPLMILGLLRSVVERSVASRDLPRATDALLRTDLALKTSGGDPQVLLERLIVELCATGRD